MTIMPPKFVSQPPRADVIEKIELSIAQSTGAQFRDVLCPYCSTPLATVAVDMQEGFLAAKCQKCKAVTPLNLAYFYTSTAYRRPPAYLYDLKLKNE